MTHERRDLTQPDDWWVAFEKQAQILDMNLSEWVGYCCLLRLKEGDMDKLSKRTPAHRPKKNCFRNQISFQTNQFPDDPNPQPLTTEER